MADLTIEGFVTDLAFTDQTKSVTDFFPSSTANIGELSSNALSYFTQPTRITDKRPASERVVNWAAQTRPQLMVDANSFASFSSLASTSTVATLSQLFGIIDKLIFNFTPTLTHAQVETQLTSDVGTKDVYVPGSYTISTTLLDDSVYTDGNTPKVVRVPAYATFDVILPSGSSTRQFTLKIYASVASWLSDYSQSTIAEVIPPLPYDRLYDSSLTASVDNLFSIASLTAMLSFQTMDARLKNTTVSGMFEFKAILQDSSNTVAVPFNILYKGRVPTLFEVRNAIRQKLLTSGVGDENGWKKRIPGVFVSGRFYVVPFWDKTFQKPDQKIFPNVLNFKEMEDVVEQVLGKLGYSNITEYMDVISIYYNRMSAAVIPDQSGVVDIKRLGLVLPDYQSFSSSDAEFAYMNQLTQTFSRELNSVLTVATNDTVSSVYGPNTEGALSFYSYTAGTYEVCVISKACYTAVLESEQ